MAAVKLGRRGIGMARAAAGGKGSPTTEIKVLLRLSCQSLSLPRPATFLVVSRKTPVTIGQVQVDFRIDFAGSPRRHDPE